MKVHESRLFNFFTHPTLKKTAPILVFILGLVWLISVLSGCAKKESSKVAEVDGLPVLASEFEKAAGKELFQQREALYRLQRQKLHEYIDALLLTKEARRRGISVATLLAEEVDSTGVAVTDEEVEDFYKTNKGQLPVGLDKLREKIRAYLQKQRTDAQKAAYLKSLRSKAEIVSYLKAPLRYRAEVSVTGAPFKGPVRAAVTIVKFEDYHCPFCKRAQAVLADVLARYDGKVRLVHKDFPLDNLHPDARQAAEAARCANEQGKFWNYHDKLYENAPKASTEDLIAYAREIGLNTETFERCVRDRKFRAAVDKDLQEGVNLQITGTPAFFINGRELSGAQPIDQFIRIIDEELAR